MLKNGYIFLIIIALNSCSSFRISRIGYQNLRENIDTTCTVEIIPVGKSSGGVNKLGRLELQSRIITTSSSKAEALTILKQEACAVNANKVYIINESYRNENKARGYSCVVDLYREVEKKHSMIDFVKRNQEEIKIAKQQKRKMEEGRERKADTLPLDEDEPVLELNDIRLTELRIYDKDSIKNETLSDEEDKNILVIEKDSIPLHKKSKVIVDQVELPPIDPIPKGVFFSVGPFYGGTSVFGCELEVAVHRFGVFGGAGIYGYGYGVNVHMKKDPISSYISVHRFKTVLHEYFDYETIGVSYNYRGEKWLTARIGVAQIQEGSDIERFDSFAPIFAIGAFVPM